MHVYNTYFVPFTFTPSFYKYVYNVNFCYHLKYRFGCHQVSTTYFFENY